MSKIQCSKDSSTSAFLCLLPTVVVDSKINTSDQILIVKHQAEEKNCDTRNSTNNSLDREMTDPGHGD